MPSSPQPATPTTVASADTKTLVRAGIGRRTVCSPPRLVSSPHRVSRLRGAARAFRIRVARVRASDYACSPMPSATANVRISLIASFAKFALLPAS